jgi:sortase A
MFSKSPKPRRALGALSDRVLDILNARRRAGSRWSREAAEFGARPGQDITRGYGLAAINPPDIEIDDRPASQAMPTLGAGQSTRFTGVLFISIGLIIVGFFCSFMLLSSVQYHRNQQINFDSFRYDLANGTAPIGQSTTEGRLLPDATPVALVSIPTLGISNVVVGEGTSSSVTMQGPGHRRDTVLPGQAGTSVVYGRQAAYGGPFNGIGSLSKGDQITTVTGQGKSTYVVTEVRHGGQKPPAVVAAGKGRLTLVSASGLPFFPLDTVRVYADLSTKVFDTPVPVISAAALTAAEPAMAGDISVLPILAIGLAFIAGFVALFVVSRRFWGKWQTWVVAVPTLFALGAFAAVQIAALLPNLI